MPLSPLTRSLIILTFLVFPFVFVTMVEPESWMAPASLGVALSLWTAALFQIVKSGAAFDERAFHPTRPLGRQEAFRRSTSVMLVVTVLVSLMAAIRAWHFNLGWRATCAGALIAFTLFLAFTVAVATGFNLAFSRARSTRWVGCMMAMPLLVHLAAVEFEKRQPWPGAKMFESWTMNLSLGVITAAVAYVIAWWLAARRGRWWPSLMACGIAGGCLSLPKFQIDLLEKDPGILPQASITIRRLPFANSEKVIRTADNLTLSMAISDFFRVGGLRNDEFMLGSGELPLASEDPPRENFLKLNPGKTRSIMVQWNGMENVARSERNWGHIAATRLETHPAIEPGQSNFYDPLYFHAAEEEAIFNALNRGDWQLDGNVGRIEHEGFFPLFTGGEQPLKSYGRFKIWPAVRLDSELRVSYRLTIPDPNFDPRIGIESQITGFEMSPGAFLLLVNQSGTRAVVSSEALHRGGSGSGLASTWQTRTVYFPVVTWPAEEIEGASVHLFTNRKVSHFDMQIPPPK